MGDTPVIGDTPVMKDTPVSGDTPVMEDTPVIGDTPVMEDTPVMIGDTLPIPLLGTLNHSRSWRTLTSKVRVQSMQ